MGSKKTILSTFLILAAALLLQFSQCVSATTFEEMLQQLRDQNLIENVGNIENQVSYPNDFLLYSSISLSEKKTYFYFGAQEKLDVSEDYYAVKLKVHNDGDKLPVVDKCTFFLRQGKSFLSRTFTPNASAFELRPTLPTGFSLTDSAYLYQCEFASPEQRNITFDVTLHYPAHNPTDPTDTASKGILVTYWSKKEQRDNKPLPEEEKPAFSKNIEFKHDDYNEKTSQHSIKITDLTQDYMDGESIEIRIGGIQLEFLEGEIKKDEMTCNIEQTLKGKDPVTYQRQLYFDRKILRVNNPTIIMKTGKTDTEDIKYYAESTLNIHCPEIALYKSRISNGPDFHTSSVILAQKGVPRHGDIFNPLIYCDNYPCSTFIHHPERQKDNIVPDEKEEKPSNKIYYYIGGGVLAVGILAGVVIACVRSKKQRDEYAPLIN